MFIHDYIRQVWHLRWPLLATHVTVSVIALALISPLIGGTLQLGLSLAGQSALADQDIAMFLLSPAGVIVFLLIGSLVLTAAVIELSAMMWVQVSAKGDRRKWGPAAVRQVIMKGPRLLQFAAHLIVRLLALFLPFLAVAGLIAYQRLSAHDINYYLTLRPAEFQTTLYIIAPILGIGALLVLNRLVAWSMALPVVLFRPGPTRRAFGISARLTKGHRLGLALRFSLWALVVLAVGALVTLGATGLAHLAEGFGQAGIRQLVTVVGTVVVIWALVLTATSTLTTAGFAALLLERFARLDTDPLRLPDSNTPLSESRMAQFGLTLIFIVGFAGALGVSLFETLKSVDQVQVIAHRGAAGLRPENTLASIQKAIDDGTDWVEIDVQESADGEVIVIHDSDFMKIAGIPVKVWEITRAELDQMDIGSHFDPAYSAERVPLLKDVLDVARDKAKVLIELKYYGHSDRLEERVAEIVEAAGMADQIAVMSLEATQVARMKALRPDWDVGFLAATAVGDLTRLNADFLAVNTGLAKPSLMRHAKSAEQPVLVWTVDDMVTMSQMISRGVWGLITDYPGRAREVIAAREGLSTGERLLIELADLMGLEIDLPIRMTDGA
ncbi:glycerophosphodiester phosphodiesterase family protein [Pseudoruegeria sp. SK021]|uniref:glycerophosphodiester phosphodiesterase family protein n=1 Tax=Pseudoruegeria sp. SK021 TaxID=1933035 RepID=UPI000A233A3E|nr:glycerophosphodiester phosphodiesterase family protein [Pseudoruegeria sp. SK021]OSP56465.1 hypothetical protein BV911_00430 [Pseudoruegeria sp. SK021]